MKKIRGYASEANQQSRLESLAGMAGIRIDWVEDENWDFHLHTGRIYLSGQNATNSVNVEDDAQVLASFDALANRQRGRLLTLRGFPAVTRRRP